MIVLHIVYSSPRVSYSLLTVTCMEGATGSAYRWAISVPIRRSRGKKGGTSKKCNCDEDEDEERWEVGCRLLVLRRKISQHKSPGRDLGRDLITCTEMNY